MSVSVQTTTTQPLIRVTALEKQYRKHMAVQGIDLSIRQGEIYGLIGPDGAGKSSLMKVIAGVLSLVIILIGGVSVFFLPITQYPASSSRRSNAAMWT